MYSIVVFDDVAEEAEALCAQLAEHPLASQFELYKAFSESDLERLATEDVRADVLFADIVLPDSSQAGIDFVRDGACGIMTSRTQTVFFSGYLEKSLDVYSVPHVYFLLKPVDKKRLFSAVNKALEALEAHGDEMVVLHEKGREVVLAPDDIVFVESRLRKLFVQTSRGVVEVYAKLGDLQVRLPSSFLRCHKSYLVNMNHIAAFRDDTIVVKGDLRVPVSQRKRKDAMTQYLDFLKTRR